MTTLHDVPLDWLSLKIGEIMFSQRPFHELQEIRKVLDKIGIAIELSPAPGGYLIERVRRTK